MRQLVQIKKILDDTHAEIFMERPSACGGQLPRLWPAAPAIRSVW